ncbi:OPT/YSL family transporter [Caldisericum exile]|uniref:Oligopeptide transporter OPT family protein n=1 Tax=Caldisericum exile (strain DSM 21853 / NBRC 104410 / AZM16c01) TaxID=511051 RepID=A0A7U6JFS1_CALEA|nr:OPT/YSL family transporter [Caldisericum exile]BAL80749.1 oligopeptide transporter OPT family protein [Caldisericum exile AZM16c01]
MQELKVRTIVLAALGSAVISMSSIYIALRIGALPWPTIFVAISSMAILKAFKNTNLKEINVAHTGMSAGAMVAGGIAFTIPGIWIISEQAKVSFHYVFLVSLIGAVIGVFMVALIREFFIEKSNLPYPVGVATAQTLVAGDEGGRKSKIVFTSLGISAIFTFLRDGFSKIPQAIMIKGLANYGIGLFMSPMAFGIGYIIGIIYMGIWFIGSIIGNIVIPVFFSMPLGGVNAAITFKNNLGIGLIIGGGIALLVKDILPKVSTIFKNAFSKLNISYKIISLVLLIILGIEFVFLKLGIIASLLTLIGAAVSVVMAAYTDGATGIVPMEIFGIIILLFVKLTIGGDTLSYLPLFAVVAIVAVASGVAGDNLQDFKAGAIIGTNPRAQIISELVGAIVGAVFGTIGLFILHLTYGKMGPGTFLVAPQAYAVSQMIQGLSNPRSFIFGLIAGFVLYFFNIQTMILGIGVYLPFIISLTAFLGGVLRVVIDKFFPKQSENFTLISSGLLGGEGFAGTIVAIIKFIWRL